MKSDIEYRRVRRRLEIASYIKIGHEIRQEIRQKIGHEIGKSEKKKRTRIRHEFGQKNRQEFFSIRFTHYLGAGAHAWGLEQALFLYQSSEQYAWNILSQGQIKGSRILVCG